MLIKDALNLLKPESTTLDAIKTAYRRASSKFHPDKGGSTQMMQAINEAYEVLCAADHIEQPESFTDYADELSEAINSIINLPGLDVELCGSWLWISGDTKTHKDILKANGFKFAPKKAMWSFHPTGFKSYGRGKASIDEIRGKYGSKTYTPGNRIYARA